MGRRFEISSVAAKAFKPVGTELILRQYDGGGGAPEGLEGLQWREAHWASRTRRHSRNAPSFHPCFSLSGCVSIPLSDFFLSAFSQVVDVGSPLRALPPPCPVSHIAWLCGSSDYNS